jgi:hypothetical protein
MKGLATALTCLSLVVALSACDAGPSKDSDDADEAKPTVAATEESGVDAPTPTEVAVGDFVVLPGTGTYAIGADAPYGGYQLHGEPDEQPPGCTWQILDGDGGVSFENTGQYVWLTDIHEAVTFVTDGCPDWEQFE